MGFGERELFAEALGLTVAMLGYYERGDRVPDADALAPYRREFDVNLGWLVTGLGDMFEQAPATSSPVEKATTGDARPVATENVGGAKEKTDSVLVEKLDLLLEQMAKLSAEKQEQRPLAYTPPPRAPATITYLPFRASAGGGSVVLDDSPGLELDIDALSSEILGLRRKNIRLIEIIGDSMLPTFLSGDVVLADTSFPRRDEGPDDGEIYVIRKEGELLVKRALWVDEETLEWRSDNSDFAPVHLEGDEINQVKMVGKVVWLWRRAV